MKVILIALCLLSPGQEFTPPEGWTVAKVKDAATSLLYGDSVQGDRTIVELRREFRLKGRTTPQIPLPTGCDMTFEAQESQE